MSSQSVAVIEFQKSCIKQTRKRNKREVFRRVNRRESQIGWPSLKDQQSQSLRNLMLFDKVKAERQSPIQHSKTHRKRKEYL